MVTGRWPIGPRLVRETRRGCGSGAEGTLANCNQLSSTFRRRFLRVAACRFDAQVGTAPGPISDR
jgi:hypothetical protein